MRTLQKLWQFTLLSLLAGSILAVPVASANSSSTQAVTQGYGTDTVLQKGMLVRLKDKDAAKVVPLTSATAAEMQGVVVAANDASVTLSSDNNSGQVFVATYGHFEALVSNQNGPIKSGDYITISSLDGVGMKADSVQSTVLGKAASNFDGTANVQGSTTVKDQGGHSVNVSFGRIPVDISISHNPLQQDINNNLPGFLKKASQFVANKPVSSSRVYISLVVLLISTVIAGSILYAGIRSGLVAIGRNPLAKTSITRNLVQVIITGLIIFIIGLFAVYLLLKL